MWIELQYTENINGSFGRSNRIGPIFLEFFIEMMRKDSSSSPGYRITHLYCVPCVREGITIQYTIISQIKTGGGGGGAAFINLEKFMPIKCTGARSSM